MSSDSASSKEPDSPEAAPTSLDYVSGPEEPEQAPFSPDYVPGPELPRTWPYLDEECYVCSSDPGGLRMVSRTIQLTGGDGVDDEILWMMRGGGGGSRGRRAATPPSPLACRTTARISIRPEAPMPFPSEEEVERLLALPHPHHHPLISLSTNLAEGTLARYLAVPALPSFTTSIVPHPYDSLTDVRAPPWLQELPMGYEVGESSTVAPRPARGYGIDYGFIGTLDAETRRQRAKEAGYGIRDEQDTQDVYAVIEDTQDRQTRLFQRVDGFVKDGKFHYETARLLDQEALVSREAWAHSVGLSSAVQLMNASIRTYTQMQIPSQAASSRASTAIGLVFSFLVSDNHNNMPPRRSSATARAAAAAARAAAAAAPMTAAAVEQLIEARVYNSDTGIRGTIRAPRECTYKEFLNCKPLYFKGTEGVVVLSQWFEKMESVFHISNCAVENQVKFATCTFLGNALTWWNSHMKTVTQYVAYVMDWRATKR
ncbi:hypothetical protein Tco_1499203 [Tanacetum coccineum]